MITIKPHIADTCRQLDSLAQSQVPFAIAKTLTDLAWESREQVQKEIPERFKVRSRWVVSGVRVDRATKSNLEAAVKHLDEKMTKQETGGTVRATNKRYISIPSSKLKSNTRPISRSRRPSALLSNKQKYFVGEDTTGRPYIAQRYKSKELKVMYFLRPIAQYKPRWGFEKTVNTVVDKRAGIIFERNLDAAIKTSRGSF